MKRPEPSQLNMGQRFTMMRQIEASLAKNPKDANARMNYGLLLREENRLTEAIEQLAKAHKLARKDLEILSILAETCLEGQKLSEARKYIRKLCEIAPNNIGYLSFYGDVLIQLGKPELAAGKFEKILKLEPDNLEALQGLLSTANMRGEQSQIDAIQKKIRTLDPSEVNAIYYEANTHRFSVEEAKRLDHDIEKAIATSDDKKAHSTLFYARGKIWSDAKDYSKAFEAYLIANKLAPSETE